MIRFFFLFKKSQSQQKRSFIPSQWVIKYIAVGIGRNTEHLNNNNRTIAAVREGTSEWRKE